VLDFGSAPGDREQGSVETALLGAEELLEGSDRTNHKYLGGMWVFRGYLSPFPSVHALEHTARWRTG